MIRIVAKITNLFAAAAFALTALAGAAAAAGYPARTVTLVVPYPPGGGVDTLARIVAGKLQDALHGTVIVDNKSGAGGTIGTRAVAHAAPDGYTLLLGHTGTISINPSLYAGRAGYDPRKDFAPIGLIASMPVALIAHPSFAPKSVADFIALARKNPGKLNVGTSAVGTGGYMCAQLFKAMAGIDVAIIPYKGTAPVMNDLLGNQIPVAFGVLPPALGNIQAKTLRVIAVTSAKRTALLPDAPTFDESGMPGFDAVLHYGLLAPAGTPKAIVDRLNAELNRIVSADDVIKRIHFEGGDPMTSTPEGYVKDIDSEETKWSGLVHKLGLNVQ